MSKEFRTSVGGQALMEGIMMRGPEKICCAVRRPDGPIDLSYDTVRTHWYNKVPLVRGVCNMVENLYKGYQYLMHAADIAMEGEAEPAESKLDKWLEKHMSPAFQNVLMGFAAFAGVAGGLFAHNFYIINPGSFTFLASFNYLIMVVMGGLGSITGSIAGAFVVTFLSAALAAWPEFRMIIYALALILLMFYRPQGLFGYMEVTSMGIFRRIFKRGRES